MQPDLDPAPKQCSNHEIVELLRCVLISELANERSLPFIDTITIFNSGKTDKEQTFLGLLDGTEDAFLLPVFAPSTDFPPLKDMVNPNTYER